MDILGVGIAELAIIAFLLLVVAGPRRTAVWARQAGVWVRQFREAWSKMMADFENEMGEDATKAIKEATQELRRTRSIVRETATQSQRLMRQAMNDATVQETDEEKPASDNGAEAAPTDDRYDAWTLKQSAPDD